MRLATALVAAYTLLASTTTASPAPAKNVLDRDVEDVSRRAGAATLCSAFAQWKSNSGVTEMFDCTSTKDTCPQPVAQARSESGCSADTSKTTFSISDCGKEAAGGKAMANNFALALQKLGFTCVPKATAYSSTTVKASATSTAASSATSAPLCLATGYYSTQSSLGINDYYVRCTSYKDKCADPVAQARAQSGCMKPNVGDTDTVTTSNCGKDTAGGVSKRNTFAQVLQDLGFTCNPKPTVSSSVSSTATSASTKTSSKSTMTTTMKTTTTTKTTSRASTTTQAGLLGGILGSALGDVEETVDGTGL